MTKIMPSPKFNLKLSNVHTIYKINCFRHMKQMAEMRFGNWWSAVIISERGGYAMSAIYDQHQNTRLMHCGLIFGSNLTKLISCEIMLFNTFYWLGRTC